MIILPLDWVSRFFFFLQTSEFDGRKTSRVVVNLTIAPLEIHEFLVSKFSTYTGNGITFGAKRAFFLSFDEFLLIFW